MKLEIEQLNLATRHTFRIARSERKTYRNIIIHLLWDGITGIGEAAPQAFYGESEDSVKDALGRIEGLLEGPPESLRERIAEGDIGKILAHDGSVRAALDMALWDMVGKREGLPCYALLDLNPDDTPLTSYTIGFDTPDVVRAKVKEAAPYKILKVKVGLPGDMEIVDLVIDESGKTVRTDANEGWDRITALKAIGELEKRGVEFVEQPISHHKKDDLKVLKEKSPLPIILDESIITPEDVTLCRDLGHGINIKLMKCGGMTPALDMIERARSSGLHVMLGCMIETSVGITAAAHLSPLADYADLDGNLLLDEDPYRGVTVTDGKLQLPSGPGLGITSKSDVVPKQ